MFEVGFVLGCAELFFREAAGALAFAVVGGSFEGVVCDAAHGGVILGSVLLPGLVVVFPEQGVQDPVATVLDGPVVADVGLELGGLYVLEAGDVVMGFDFAFRPAMVAVAADHDEGFQAGPCAADVGIHPFEVMAGDGLATFVAAMGPGEGFGVAPVGGIEFLLS